MKNMKKEDFSLYYHEEERRLEFQKELIKLEKSRLNKAFFNCLIIFFINVRKFINFIQTEQIEIALKPYSFTFLHRNRNISETHFVHKTILKLSRKV